MSGYKQRNRSIRQLPMNLTSKFKNPFPNFYENEKRSNNSTENLHLNSELENQFIKNEVCSPTDSGDSSILLRLSGLSSSSSLSWSDEYESGVTKQVQDQLEKLDRIFLGLQEVSNEYDKTEIAEWIDLFPNICILGSKTPLNSPCHSESDTDLSSECDTKYNKGCICSNSSMLVKHLSPSASITQKKIPDKNFIVRNEELLYAKGRGLIKYKHCYTPHKVRSLDIEKYLKISPIQSSKQSNQRKVPATKEPTYDIERTEHTEYTSLPFINVSSSKFSNQHSRILEPVKKTSEKLVLPPIANQFRSISATPRHSVRNSFSVFGTNLKQQKRKHLISFVEHIPLTNR